MLCWPVPPFVQAGSEVFVHDGAGLCKAVIRCGDADERNISGGQGMSLILWGNGQDGGFFETQRCHLFVPDCVIASIIDLLLPCLNSYLIMTIFSPLLQ